MNEEMMDEEENAETLPPNRTTADFLDLERHVRTIDLAVTNLRYRCRELEHLAGIGAAAFGAKAV